jgi:hypothetical protein
MIDIVNIYTSTHHLWGGATMIIKYRPYRPLQSPEEEEVLRALLSSEDFSTYQ